MSRGRSPETPCPERLSDADRAAIIKWCSVNYPGQLKRLGCLWQELAAWAEEHDVQSRSWRARFRRWIINAHRFDQERDRVRGHLLNRFGGKPLSRQIEAQSEERRQEIESFASGAQLMLIAGGKE